jgi:GNAT superfamily N-acetyltransferase
MPSPGLRFRAARPEDAKAVAALHTDSWRRHYRGAYSDAFLDEEAPEFLGRQWTERLTEPGPNAYTLLAESEDEGEGVLVGLAHTMLDEDPRWGALVDNLHVRYAVKRQGIGSRLLALTAQTVRRRSSTWGLHLWVLEQNSAAQAFYAAQGGKRVERAAVPPPGGDPARLNGRPFGLRIAWPDSQPCTCGELHPQDAACRVTDMVKGRALPAPRFR